MKQEIESIPMPRNTLPTGRKGQSADRIEKGDEVTFEQTGMVGGFTETGKPMVYWANNEDGSECSTTIDPMCIKRIGKR